MRFNKKRLRDCRRGFMMLEIVLAVGIFAFAIVGLASAMRSIIDAELLSREDQRVRLEVQSRLSEAKMTPLEIGKTEMEPDQLGYKYTREVEEVELTNENEEQLTGLFLIRVSAFKDDEVTQSAEVVINANARF